MEYDDNHSSDLVEIEERNNAYFFLGDYVEEKYGEPYSLKLYDDFIEEDHHSPPSHESLFPNIS